MKQLLFITLLCTSVNFSFSQSYNEDEDLYSVALEKYVNHWDSFYVKHSTRPSCLKVIYLENTQFIDSIPKSINKRKIIVLTEKNWQQIYKENNNKLIHVKVSPIHVKNGKIKISFIPYLGRVKRKKIDLTLSTWTDIFFQFNCETGSWEYEKTEQDGIY